MSYSASCPACGAPLVFGLDSTLLKVCDHCGVAVARKGANLETYGKVAELIPTPSLLALGCEGDYAGAPPFKLVGRLQIDHGAGTWDEWLMGFEDGTWAWLSESQGKFHYMGAQPLPPAPAFGDLRVGETLDLGPPGVFVVAEVKTAKFVSAQGELPFDVPPGSPLNYADLSGPHGQFATLDYGTGSEAEALYVGREVTLDELKFKELPEREGVTKAKGGAVSCPQCGGPLEIRAPDLTQRVGCPWCGSLLDATKDLAVLQTIASVKVKPLIPLGSRGRLRGGEWTLIGFMERSTTVEGIRYPWREYLLHDPRHGFRWLVEARGHWSFVEPAHVGDVKEQRAFRRAQYRGRRFKHFQSSKARVDTVLGEFYWAVAHGDTTQMEDYVSPPEMLSKESDGSEVQWSLGTYLDRHELWKAFGAPGRPPGPGGVAPNQPWKHAATAPRVYRRAWQFMAVAFILFIGLAISRSHQIIAETVEIPDGAVSGAPESARFLGPFDLPSEGNVQIKVHAPVSNSWLYLDGALINEQTGELSQFEVEISYYFGRDSDGAWVEGSPNAVSYVPAVPAGKYLIRLAPQWQKLKAPARYEVNVRSGVPRFSHLVLALVALGFWPAMLLWRNFRFEMQRWSESDHPWVEQS